MFILNEFKVNESENFNYYNFENGICIIICFYVDELFIFISSILVVYNVKSLLCNNFDMKDL